MKSNEEWSPHCAGLLVAFGSTRCSGSASGRAPFAPLEKWKKTIFKLKKNNYFICELLDVTCQTTRHCVQRPAWNETPGCECNFCNCIRSLKKIHGFNGVWDFKPCWSPEFISDFLCNCINCIHKSEDHSSFDNNFCYLFILPCITCSHSIF